MTAVGVVIAAVERVGVSRFDVVVGAVVFAAELTNLFVIQLLLGPFFFNDRSLARDALTY